MKVKVLPVALLFAGAGLGFAIVSSFMGKERLARLAPASTTLWMESQDLQGTLAEFKASEAWPEFEASKSYEELEKGWGELVKVAEEGQIEILTQLGLGLNERTVLHFVGKDVAIGALAPADANPSLVLMTQLDVAGILEDVATQGDWTALWGKLETALGGENVTTEEYKGYDVASRALGGPGSPEVHFSLVEDVLVVSHSKDTVKAVVDVKVGERPSLADQAAFGQEVGNLPDEEVAYTYFDLAFLRDKERVKSTVHRLGALAGAGKEAEMFTGEELQVLIDDLQEIDGLAVAATIPDGNVYDLDVVTSREADDVFKDNEHHDLRQLVSSDTLLFVETHGLYDLVANFASSEAVEVLTETEAAKWLAKKLEKPEELAELMGPGGAPPGMDLKKNPAFELKMFWAALKLELREILGNDIAVAIETREAEEPTEAIRPLVFLRSRPLLRILTDVASGALAVHADKNEAFSVEPYGEQQIFSASEGPMGVHWTRIGQDLVLSSQKDMVQRVIDKAGDGGEGNPILTKTMEKLPEGYQGFFYFDQARYKHLLGHMMSGNEAEQLDKMFAMTKGMEVGAFAFYVAEDYTSITLRSYAPFGEDLDPTLKAAYKNADDEPAAWSRLPEETMASFVMELDAPAVYGFLKKYGVSSLGEGGEEQINEMLAEIEEKALGGKSIENDLLASLGQSHGLGLIRQDKLPVEGTDEKALGQMLAVPAVGALFTLVDGETFAPVFKELVEAGLEQANAAASSAGQSRVIGTLYTLSTAQSLFREGDKEGDQIFDYGTLGEMGEATLIDMQLASGTAHGYRYEVYVSKEAPEFLWIATAKPIDLQPGDVTYIINQGGVVFYTDETVTLDDTCEPPASAQPYGGDAPAPRETTSKGKDAGFHMAEIELAGEKAWSLVLPGREVEQMTAMVGEGFGLCYAIVENELLIASSHSALAKMIAADSPLNDSDDFERAIDDQPTEVAAFYHLSLAGVIDQITANGEMIARESAPAPASIVKPEYPEFPSDATGDDFEKAYEEYEKKMEAFEALDTAYRTKVRAWKQENAAENAKEFTRILESLDVLGDFLGYSILDDDGEGLESVGRYQLNLDAQ